MAYWALIWQALVSGRWASAGHVQGSQGPADLWASAGHVQGSWGPVIKNIFWTYSVKMVLLLIVSLRLISCLFCVHYYSVMTKFTPDSSKYIGILTNLRPIMHDTILDFVISFPLAVSNQRRQSQRGIDLCFVWPRGIEWSFSLNVTLPRTMR